MRRESNGRRVLPRFESLEGRALLSASPGTATPAAAAPTIVAVISSGIDINAGDPIHVLASNKYLDMTDAYSAIDGSSLTSDVADADPSKEGTRILNEVLQGINDAVAAGGSSNVEVVPIRDYDSTSLGVPIWALAGSIDHAADLGAKVIDLNYEAPSGDLTTSQVQEIQQAIAYAQSQGAAVIVPAGDEFPGSAVGVNLDQSGANRVLEPDALHTGNMMVVAATDSSGNLGSLSDWGAVHVDVGSPTTLANRVTGLAAGYASGVAAVIAATRTDWDGSQVIDRLEQTVQPSASLAGKVTSGGMISPTNALAGIAGVETPQTPGDINGNAKSDFSLYANIPNSPGYGFAVLSSTQAFSTSVPTIVNNAGYSVGDAGTIPVSGDFYGTGITEPALFAPQYGANGQLDGKYDFAILSQNAQGNYYVSTFIQGIGQAGDVPVVGDFEGDGKDDLALYGDHNGLYDFQIFTAASNFNPANMETLTNNGLSFGGPGSVPVVGDFFGNGKDDPAVYGPEYTASGQLDGKYAFAALDSGSFNTAGQYTRGMVVGGIGQNGDIPIVGKYESNGNGKDDFALYGDHNGQYNFKVLTASSGYNANQMIILNNNGIGFGGPGSVPIAGDFFGDGGPDISVFGPEYGANGQLDGNYDFASIDLSPKTSPTLPSRSIIVKGFGGPTTIPDAAPPWIKWFEAQEDS
jgi:hypothetical protein